MSVQTQIKKDWDIAIKSSMSKKIIDRSNQKQICIDSTGNEYYFKYDTGDDKTFTVFRPGINITCWRKYFKLKWVHIDYNLKPLK